MKFSLPILAKGTETKNWYMKLKWLSDGGYSAVWRGCSLSYRSGSVSIKQVKLIREGKTKRNMKDEILAEIAFLRKAQSDFVLKFVDFTVNKKSIWIITELCTMDAGQIPQFLIDQDKKPKKIAVQMIFHIISPVFMALAWVHGHCAAIHRDIKPENILFTQSGIPKLCDFGLAVSSEIAIVTNEKDIFGTDFYVAPEFFTAGNVITNKIDSWSLGITMLSLLLNSEPYGAIHQPGFTVVKRWFTSELFEQDMQGPSDITLYKSRNYTKAQATYFSRLGIIGSIRKAQNVPTQILESFLILVRSLLMLNPEERVSVREIMTDSEALKSSIKDWKLNLQHKKVSEDFESMSELLRSFIKEWQTL